MKLNDETEAAVNAEAAALYKAAERVISEIEQAPRGLGGELVCVPYAALEGLALVVQQIRNRTGNFDSLFHVEQSSKA